MPETTKKTAKKANPFDVAYGTLTETLVETLGSLGARSKKNLRWKPGEKLQILFEAYSGARNTGAEVRVAECIRQTNKVLGDDRVDINMSTLDLKEAGEYFKRYRVNLKEFSAVFFKDIYKLCLENHLIVLVEGSCWKENFASALMYYFAYAAGLAHKLGKPCFSYSVDAGEMNDFNNKLAYKLCKNMTRYITRSADSARVLKESIGLGPALVRVDTAWTQEANPPEFAVETYKKKGWDGKKKLFGLAMQNYMIWPILPDLNQWVRSKVTGDEKNLYKLVYFYDYGPEDEKFYNEWAGKLARFMDWAAEEYDVQPVLIAMEALDEKWCKEFAQRMKHNPIIISCNEFVGDEIASLLRQLTQLTTTRYHAMVLSMPGRIPFIGLSRDERIRGVMKETGLYDDYYVDYREADLENILIEKTRRIMEHPEEHARLREVINENLPYYYAQMAMLGLDIRNIAREAFPGFEPIPLDEDDAMALIPFCPEEYVERTRAKFLELKRAEAGAK